jgi:two-component system nitrogen regulation response regulator NtrX
MILVLVVDDVFAMAEQYAYDLKRVGGYEVVVATGGEQALDILTGEAVDCVILDLEMPGTDGFQVLRKLRERGSDTPVIVYTGTGNFDRCMQAIRLGAYSFIDKAEPMERVVREVENALERRRLETEVKTLRRETGSDSPLLGSSRVMSQLKQQIGRVAPVPSPVLITGESGTGKELVAKELHRLAFGNQKPFVAINSAALPENLIESELFGHERGAFTGASRTHKGAFEMATGGTLFLDEIGELPAPAQAKLLRVLEQKQVTRLGGERLIDVDARVVAATNRDLEAEVEAGRFRQDLYYRINVHILRVPPLRDRLSDLPELINYFLSGTCARFGVSEKKLDSDALESMMNYPWRRNNVRELRNIVERMVISTDAESLGVDQVPTEVRSGQISSAVPGAVPETVPEAGTFQERKSEAERQIVVAALEENNWNITQTAQQLGLADHASLLKIMRRHNLKRS